ncbi:MAG: hemerythrin domain-containing protein, partial [Proteobacteria bacterium]|nr:hemerythrin domain-containing protein [Pseudomonadota bacterium]
MKTNARDIMAELRDDHRNMAIVLDLLEDIVAEMEAGRDPDFELFDEIMRYMTVYPDAVHHPKEDVVYAELR